MWKGLALLGVAELGASVKRSVVVGAIYAVATVALLCSLGFLVAAGHGALAWRYGANAANLILAGWFFVWPSSSPLSASPSNGAPSVAAPLPPRPGGGAGHCARGRAGARRRPNLAASIAAGVLAVGALVGSRWATRSDT